MTNKSPPTNLSRVLQLFSKESKNVPLEIFHNDHYKTLVSTIMSSRTKDETTLKASKRLFKKAPSVSKLSKLSEQEIMDLIFPVGFYKTKTKQLKKLSLTLLKNHKSKVPNTLEGLTQLPGIGRKTANLVLNSTFDKPAIAVDTHVHKISNLLGWVKTKNPEETEKVLIEIIPKKYWSKINTLFVSVGRNHNSKRKLINFLKEKNLL
jgi:endonuclease-3